MDAQDRAPARRLSSDAPPALELESFLPYRLSSLAESVSRALAAIYRDRFDLTRPEWRALAVLAREEPLTAAELGRRTELDKMQVSRAVQALVRKGDVVRKPSPTDQRTRRLALTAQGRRLYERIAPIALAREMSLRSALSAKEQRDLMRIIDKLAVQAGRLENEPG